MCKFVVTRPARSHIQQRICQRFLHKDPREDPEARAAAGELLNTALAVLRAQTPADWRFTRNPAAHFFISLVARNPQAPPDVISETQLKLLGGSYRRGEAGQELKQRLMDLASGLHTRSTREGPPDSPHVRSELTALRDLYLQDLQDPQADIIHELKTAYLPSEDIAQRRRTKQRSLEAHTHTMVLRSMNLPHLHAALPNALLWSPAGEGQQLWVRQGDSWWAPQLKGEKNARELALFVPLRPEGPDHSAAQLWSFDIAGKIKRLEGGCGASYAPGQCQTPEGFRSESYWNLPTWLDSFWLDCDYRWREQVPALTGRDLVTFAIVNWIYELATAEADRQTNPPAWLGKGG